MTNGTRWWMLLETFKEDFQTKWQNSHPGEKTPDYKLIELTRKQFTEGYSDFLGKPIKTTFYNRLSEEDEKLEKQLKKEANDYRLQEEMYIAERVYEEIGWEEFLQQIESSYFRNELKVLFDYFLPCGSADAQCSLYCPVYEVCKGNVQEMQEYKEKAIATIYLG